MLPSSTNDVLLTLEFSRRLLCISTFSLSSFIVLHFYDETPRRHVQINKLKMENIIKAYSKKYIANFLRFSITYCIINFRDYIKRRMRFAEGMWEIALKHESYVATEMVLKELLSVK